MDFHAATTKDFNKYYTVMSPMPEGQNREQALAMLSSISHVKTMTILQVRSVNGETQRLGLIGVDDDESVFRLTSRRFMVRQDLRITHQLIDSNSKLVKHFVKKDLPVTLRYYSTNRKASSIVFEFFCKFGELEWVGLKAANGQHELSLRASREFSIRQLSTDLSVRVGDIQVEIDYPEEVVSLEYFQHDLKLVQEIKKASAEPTCLVMDRAYFFNPRVAEEPEPSSSGFKATLICNEYDFQDDQLSQLDSEDMEDLDETSFYDYGSMDAKYNLNYFESSLTQQLMSANCLSEYLVPVSKETIKKKKSKRSKRSQKAKSQLKQDAVDNTTDACIDMNKLTDACSAQGKSKRGQNTIGVVATKNVVSKSKHSTLTKSADSETNNSNGSDNFKTQLSTPPAMASIEQPSEEAVINDMGDCSGDNEMGSCEYSNDGSALLQMISVSCSDFEGLNSSIMPEVHLKWRRFVEIKDEMRREKYSEYLMSKKKENAETAAEDSSHPAVAHAT